MPGDGQFTQPFARFSLSWPSAAPPETIATIFSMSDARQETCERKYPPPL